MAPLVVMLPIHPDDVEAWRRLCQEMMGTRREQYERSRRQLGIVEECISLLPAARGRVAMIAIDVAEPERFLVRLAASSHPFDRWFKRQLRQIQGIDVIRSANYSRREVLFEWRGHDARQ